MKYNKHMISDWLDFIVGMCAAVIPLVITLRSNSVKQAKRDQKLDDHLLAIDKKLDEHNHYAQKFEEIEAHLARVDTNLEYLKKGVHLNEPKSKR